MSLQSKRRSLCTNLDLLNGKPRYHRLPSAAPSSETKGDATAGFYFFDSNTCTVQYLFTSPAPPFVTGLGGYGFLISVPLVLLPERATTLLPVIRRAHVT